MSTFSKLSLVAQYDDMCRLVNKLIQDSSDEEEASIAMLESLHKRWNTREATHEREKDNLKAEIGLLQKEIKKLNRQLAESRTALVREADEKKNVAREKKALLDQIRQVRQLVEKESYGDTDAHRKRVIKCLDIERLSPIQSDDSDDCASGLDYDKTEEDILDGERSRRSTAFDDALENLAANEQPTLLYRYLDKNSDNIQQDNYHNGMPRRSRRLQSLGLSGQSTNNAQPPTSATSGNHRFADLNLETDSNSMETDDTDIELIRQQLQQHEADKREKLTSTSSNPHIRDQKKSATLSAKSAANLMKTVSNINSPVPNLLKPHSFVSKKIIRPGNCVPCGRKIAFYSDCLKCEVCGVTSHPNCKDKCPLPCVKITAPDTRFTKRKILISHYVSDDAFPKVPALIIHCCKEIEREDNITTENLYVAVRDVKDVQDLQAKIIKSKSGMPNLSNVDAVMLSAVVKHFLQSLDESLLTTSVWTQLDRLDSEDKIREQLRHFIVDDLPDANRDTLCYLMQHLHAIAKNNMTKKSLANAMAPTIVGFSRTNPDLETRIQETKTQYIIMQILFDFEEEFWAIFVPRHNPSTPATSLGSRLLAETPTGRQKKNRGSRFGSTLPVPTPKLKPLF